MDELRNNNEESRKRTVKQEPNLILELKIKKAENRQKCVNSSILYHFRE